MSLSPEAEHRAWVRTARSRKADRLVGGCRLRGIDASTAALLDQPGRDALAGIVKVRPPSPETWALVVERLARGEQAR